MKKQLIKISFFGILIATTFLVSNVYAASTLKEVKGTVSTQAQGSQPDAWTAVTQETSLNGGEVVQTGTDGSASLVTDEGTFNFGSKTTATFGPKTETEEAQFKIDALGDVLTIKAAGTTKVSSDALGVTFTVKNGDQVTLEPVEGNKFKITNSCDSTSPLVIEYLGETSSIDPCQSQTLGVPETATGAPELPGTGLDNTGSEPTVGEGTPGASSPSVV